MVSCGNLWTSVGTKQALVPWVGGDAEIAMPLKRQQPVNCSTIWLHRKSSSTCNNRRVIEEVNYYHAWEVDIFCIKKKYFITLLKRTLFCYSCLIRSLRFINPSATWLSHIVLLFRQVSRVLVYTVLLSASWGSNNNRFKTSKPCKTYNGLSVPFQLSLKSREQKE